MTQLVSPADIERIVGINRHPVMHYARAVSAEQTVYILHSQSCRDSIPDLRDCQYSLALDRGIDIDRWEEDIALRIDIENGQLVPAKIELGEH